MMFSNYVFRLILLTYGSCTNYPEPEKSNSGIEMDSTCMENNTTKLQVDSLNKLDSITTGLNFEFKHSYSTDKNDAVQLRDKISERTKFVQDSSSLNNVLDAAGR